MKMDWLHRWRQKQPLVMPAIPQERITVNWLGMACLWEAGRRPVRVTCGERWSVFASPECFEGPELLVDFHEGVLALTDIDLVLWVVKQAVCAAMAAERL